jgi:hypothetical protein
MVYLISSPVIYIGLKYGKYMYIKHYVNVKSSEDIAEDIASSMLGLPSQEIFSDVIWMTRNMRLLPNLIGFPKFLGHQITIRWMVVKSCTS